MSAQIPPSNSSDPNPRPKPTDSAQFSAKAKKRWPKLVVFALGCFVCLGLSLSALLYTDAGRHLALSKVFSMVEQTTGWKIHVKSSEIQLWAGSMDFQGLTAGSDLDLPFLVAEQVTIGWSWDQIYNQGHWTLDSVSVRSPILDLAAELPTAPNPDPEPGPLEVPVSILAWQILGGETRGRDLDQGWLAAWSARDLNLDGSLVDQGLALEVTGGNLVLTPRYLEIQSGDPSPATDLLPKGPTRIRLGGRLRGPLSGPWRIEGLGLNGEGLQIDGSGEIGPGPDSKAHFEFAIDAWPGAWAAQLSESSHLLAQGDLDLRQVQGRLELQLMDLPAEAFEPFMSPDLFKSLSASRTLLNANADLELNGPNPADAKGNAELRWHKPSKPSVPNSDTDLVTAQMAIEPDGALSFDVQASPSASGIRRVSGRIVADDLRRLDQGRLLDGKVEISTPSLTQTLAQLRQHWPNSVPTQAPDGQFQLLLQVAGSFGDPNIQGTGRFRPLSNPSAGAAAGRLTPGLLQFEIEARPSRLTGQLVAELQDLDMTAVLPPETALEVCGSIDPTGEASLSSQPCSTTASGSITLQVDRGKSTATAEFDFQPPEGGPLRIVLPPHRIVELDSLQFALSAEGPGSAVADSKTGRPMLDPLRWSYDLSGGADYVTLSESAGLATSEDIEISGGPHLRLGDLSWSASIDRQGFNLGNLEGEFSGAADAEPIPISLEAQGRWIDSASGLRPLVDRFDAYLQLSVLKPAVEPTRVHLWVRDGMLSVDIEESPPSAEAKAGSVTASMPLGTLVDFGIAVEDLPFEVPSRGPIEIWVDLPRFDSDHWLEAFHQAPPGARLQGRVKGSLTFDPAQPVASTGQWRIEDLRITTPDHGWVSDSPVSLSLADGWVKLPLTESQLDDLPMTIWAESELTPGWTLDAPILELPASLTAELNTRLDASLLKGFTDPFDAEGPLDVDIRVEGSRQSRAALGNSDLQSDAFGLPPWLQATFKVSGKEAALTSNSPYATRLEGFDIEGSWARGKLDLESLRTHLNEGELEVFGQIEFLKPAEPEGEIKLVAELKGFFDRVRYRLDYGLTLLSSGNFTWKRDKDPPDRLSANILVERGSARRRIDATRELINQLLAPPALDLGPGQVPNIDLDIDIGTIDGIRIKNNLADLHASWDLLSIEGPMSAPRTHGSIDITPDGRVYAYGQVLRIDKASLQLSGNPSLPSRLELETTSSIEDPSIATPEDRRFLASSDYPGDNDPFATENEEGGRNASRQIASGLTTFYGNQLASRLSQGLGSTRIRYEPLWIFGETDPGARLVISQDLNAYVSLAVAVDVAQGREQVYLLDLHGLRILPSLSATIFADEGDRYGATFQQTLELGGEDQAESAEQDPVLRRLLVQGAESFSLRKLTAWSGVAEGDPMPSGSDFDLEIDLAESLRQRGFPGAKIEARLVPVDDDAQKVDAVVEVELGPEVVIELTGDKLPRARRHEIRALYQTDFSRQASLEAMKKRTIEVWRSLGYPEPEVEVEFDPTAQNSVTGRPLHRVVVHSAPGRRMKLKEVELHGLSSDVADLIQPTVAGGLTRMRLALEQPQAIENLEASLSSLGLPEATIDSIRVSDATLILEISPGPQQRIADIQFSGFPAELETSTQEAVKLETGAPAAGHTIAEAALTAQWHLRSQGYPEATVRPVTTPVEGSNPPRLDLRLEAEPGTFTTFGQLKVSSGTRTQEGWLQRMATFKTGQPFNAAKVAETRRRLLQTRIFDHVRIQREVDDQGRAELTLDLEDKAPYTLAYGLRWDHAAGWGGLVDLRRLNAGGRGIGLGARALWLSEQKSLRLYSQIPRLLGTDWDLELFGEGFETDDLDSLSTEGTIFSAQLSFPLGKYTKGQLYTRFENSKSFDLGLSESEPERLRSPRVGMQWIHDRRDQPTDPRRGYFLSLDLTRAWDLESQDREYRRIYGQASLFRGFTLAGRRWIWAQSIRVGAGDSESRLRRSNRFFAGGQYSVRGYNSRSLGPQETLDDGSERAQGGEAMLILNQELRIPLIDDVSLAVFLDAGQVWGRLDDVDDALAKAAGLGVRYRSPVGLLRLDFALPLDPRPRDDDFEIYFGFGQSF